MSLRLWKRRPRTVTLPLWHDARITLPEPAWCAGHESAVAEHPVDVRHIGIEIPLYAHADGQTFELLAATVVHEPFSSGDALPAVSVDLGDHGFRRFTRGELLDFAEGLVQHAGYLREFAGEVEELRQALKAEGDR